ncbi:MAG TPA: GNAT family N-acetyltransferase [Bacilli bacterium]|nr:GNAT family N-acetyltransferase [Bacilli bacterium]
MTTINQPLLTAELAQVLEKSDCDVMRGRLHAISQHEGNPYAVEIKEFGRATALMAGNFPVIDFNRVYNLGEEEIDHLDEILAFYAKAGREFMADIAPHRSSPKLMQALEEHGFTASHFHTALYGVPDVSRVQAADGLEVRPITEAEVELFGEVFTTALETPKHIPERRESNLVLLGDPQWHLYLCWQGNTAIGFAMMQIVDGVAGFALAATIPEYRGRGAQAALLHKRMHDAVEAGAHLMVVQCEFGSVSHRNLQRAGFATAYTKMIYKKLFRS